MNRFKNYGMIAKVGSLLCSNMTAVLEDNDKLFGMGEEAVRSSDFYIEVVPSYSLEEFRSHFRMTRSCFADLMSKIAHANDVIELEKKLLFTVWMLSKQESFLAAGDRFDYSKSSGHRAFCEILDAICTLHTSYVSWPERSSYEQIAQAFRTKSGGFIPGVVGAIDGCHIQIKQPVRNPIDYYNRKNTHSLILQAVCDHRAVFTDVHIGAPGRMHDARVFRTSPLYCHLGNLVPNEFHLLGDAAYPLMGCLLTPFRNNGHLSPSQISYNVGHSKARVVIERAFGLLKGRFRRLKYIDTSKPELANKIVCCSIILHNHIQKSGDDDFDMLDQSISEQDVQIEQIPNSRRGAGNIKRDYIVSLFP